jgi:hypothetical protein
MVDVSDWPDQAAPQDQAAVPFPGAATGLVPLRYNVPGATESNNFLVTSPERSIEGLMDLDEGIDWVSPSKLRRAQGSSPLGHERVSNFLIELVR